MKEYRTAMEYCVPPSDFAARLEERILAVEPNQQKRVIRPLSFAKKVLLAAALAATRLPLRTIAASRDRALPE